MTLGPKAFQSARLKVQRANRHIDEFQAELATFVEHGFYAIHVLPYEGARRVTKAGCSSPSRAQNSELSSLADLRPLYGT